PSRPNVNVCFHVRDKALPRPLVLDVHLKRIAADKAGIRLVGTIRLVRGAVDSAARADHHLLTEDSTRGAIANRADFSGLHRNRRGRVAAGAEYEWCRATTRLSAGIGCIYGSYGNERHPD